LLPTEQRGLSVCLSH